jgi:hypothetical protein
MSRARVLPGKSHFSPESEPRPYPGLDSGYPPPGADPVAICSRFFLCRIKCFRIAGGDCRSGTDVRRNCRSGWLHLWGMQQAAFLQSGNYRRGIGLWPHPLRDCGHARVHLHVLAQNDGLGNLSHRFTFLPALLLQSKVGLLLAQPQIALQNSFGALHNLACL